MKKLLIPFALLLLFTIGCRRTATNEVDTKAYSYADSVYIENEFDEGYSYYSVNLDVPVTGNDSLCLNILHWMLSSETEDYKTFTQEESERFFSEEGREPRSAREDNYTLSEQTDKYLTYITEGYLYTGGAHPLPWYFGTTFSKVDNKIVGYDLFEDPQQLIDIIAENIKQQYFDKYNTEEEEYFFEPEENFGLPKNEPWIETDSVVFCYEAYEIAPYAAGLPLCKIALSDLKPYLSEKGKSLINND